MKYDVSWVEERVEGDGTLLYILSLHSDISIVPIQSDVGNLVHRQSRRAGTVKGQIGKRSIE